MSIEHLAHQAHYCGWKCSNKAYRRRHREKVLVQKRASHHRNKVSNNARSRQRHRLHRAQDSSYMRQYYQDHGDEIRERMALWGRQNRALTSEASRLRRLRVKQVEICEVTDRDWERLVARWEGKCAYCRERPWEHRDHVIPIARGGRHAIGNLLPACPPCNCSKKDKTIAEWRIWLIRTRTAA